jgi:hypothetical protein
MASLSDLEQAAAASADRFASLQAILREVPEALLTLRGQRCRLVREIDGLREELDEDDVRRMLLERIG